MFPQVSVYESSNSELRYLTQIKFENGCSDNEKRPYELALCVRIISNNDTDKKLLFIQSE